MAQKRNIKKIMLVFPPVTNTRTTNNICCVPMGIAYLGAYIRREGYEVKLLDAAVEGYFHEEDISPRLIRYGLPFGEIAERIAEYKPDVLGLSCIFSSQMPTVRRIAQDAKRNLGDVVIVTGGTHPSFLPEEVLKDESLDFVVQGEGELIFSNLLSALKEGRALNEVRGIAYRDNGKVIVNPQENLIEDLDTLPWPARDLLPMEKYFKINVPVQSISKRTPNTSFTTSRGCPYRCTFCSSSLHWKRYRMRSADNVLDEMGYLIETYGMRELKFEDDNLTFDCERSRRIFEGMIERGYDLTWNTPNGVVVRTLTEDMLRLMKRSGCFDLTLAIESGDPDVLKNIIHKPLNLVEAELAAKRCREIGIETTGYFIFGFPGETREQIFRTFKFAKKLKLDRAYFFIFNPLVGTPLHQKCIDEGLLTNEYSNEDDNYFISRFKSPNWTAEELYRWQKKVSWSYNLSLFFRNPPRFVKKYWFTFYQHPRFVTKALKSLIQEIYGALFNRLPEEKYKS